MATEDCPVPIGTYTYYLLECAHKLPYIYSTVEPIELGNHVNLTAKVGRIRTE